MKAILSVILNVSVCFPRGSVGVEILIPGGVWGVELKKISRLAIACHDPPPMQHTFNFYPGLQSENNGLRPKTKFDPQNGRGLSTAQFTTITMVSRLLVKNEFFYTNRFVISFSIGLCNYYQH